MKEVKIRCDDNGALKILFYVRDHVQMVRLEIARGVSHAGLTLESFWRQMTQIMDEAAGLGVPNAIGVYTCDSCKDSFKFSSKSGDAPKFCPICGTATESSTDDIRYALYVCVGLLCRGGVIVPASIAEIYERYRCKDAARG